MSDTPVRRCPVCRKPRMEEHRPFCSARCKDRDLNRWFTDSYAVPGRPALPEELESNFVLSPFQRRDTEV